MIAILTNRFLDVIFLDVLQRAKNKISETVVYKRNNYSFAKFGIFPEEHL